MRLRSRPVSVTILYAVVISLIVVTFGWQMLQGICPVP